MHRRPVRPAREANYNDETKSMFGPRGSGVCIYRFPSHATDSRPCQKGRHGLAAFQRFLGTNSYGDSPRYNGPLLIRVPTNVSITGNTGIARITARKYEFRARVPFDRATRSLRRSPTEISATSIRISLARIFRGRSRHRVSALQPPERILR